MPHGLYRVIELTEVAVGGSRQWVVEVRIVNESVSVLILAGGRSQRMGQDKVWMELDGVSLIQRVVMRVAPIAREMLFSTNTPGRFAALINALSVPARIVTDRFPGIGPLAGLHAGLTEACSDWVLVLAGDMPFVSLGLIRYMLSMAADNDAVVPKTISSVSGLPEWEPLHGLYRKSCLPFIEARIANGERPAYCFLPDVQTRCVLPTEIVLLDPEFRSFFNVNTPQDWSQAQEWAHDTHAR